MMDYNFFSKYEKKKGLAVNIRSPYFAGGLIAGISVLIAMILIGLNIFASFRITSMTAELDVLKASKEYKDAVFYQNSLASMSNYDKASQIALDKFIANNKISTEYLNIIASLIPTPIVLTNISINNANLSISCTAPDRRPIAELVKSLEESGIFLNTVITTIALDDQAKTFSATIYCITKDGE